MLAVLLAAVKGASKLGILPRKACSGEIENTSPLHIVSSCSSLQAPKIAYFTFTLHSMASALNSLFIWLICSFGFSSFFFFISVLMMPLLGTKEEHVRQEGIS